MLPKNTKIIIIKWDGWSGDMAGDPTGEVAYVYESAAYELPNRGGRYYCKVGENASELGVINKGEEEMTNEEVKNPEYIIIVKNTETYKKGGVMSHNGSEAYRCEKDSSTVFHVRQYAPSISAAQAQVLLSKKIAVEAVKFNPEFVTLEQEALLTKTLAGMNKNKPTVKKAPAKKPAAKKGAK